MFERYTEKARRTIFFARYEASQAGGDFIESEHLLLAILREDKALTYRYLRSSCAAADSIRGQIEGKATAFEKVSDSIDIPLSYECKRILAYAAEEAERLTHKHIDPEHLLAGILREEKSGAAQLLLERGLNLDLLRKKAHQSRRPIPPGGSASVAGLEQWLAAREADGGAWTVERQDVGDGITHFAIYAGSQSKVNEEGQEEDPAKKLAEIRKRTDFIAKEMERAVANHEFEKANLCLDEARKERENLRLLRKQFGLEEPALPVPFLCIEIIDDGRLSEIQRRCDDYMDGGVAEVWLLNADLKRAYTVNKAEGLREFKGEILRIAGAPLEMDLRGIFD